MPTDFSAFLTRDEYARHLAVIHAHLSKKPSEVDSWTMPQAKAHMVAQMAAFLEHKRDAGELQRIPGTGGRRLSFDHDWNEFLQGLHGERVADLLFNMVFVEKASEVCWKHKGAALPEEVITEAYHAHCAAMTRGDFPSGGIFNIPDIYDFNWGGRFSAEFQGWVPRIGRLVDGVFQAIQDIEAPPAVTEMSIELKGSELLVADWFRIPGFDEAVPVPRSIDINALNGTVEMARLHLERDGFISVHVGSSYPKVIQGEGVLAFGDVEDQLQEGFQELGSVDTKYWAVTIIERARLVEILSPVHGAEEAEKLVAAYVENEDNGVTRIPVEPGTRWVYFGCHSSLFREAFQPEDIADAGVGELTFMVCDHQRDLKTGARLDIAASLKP